MAEPSQSWHVHIVDAVCPQAIGERFTVKLGIVSGARDRTHIDNLADLMSPQQMDKVLQGARGMADR